MQHGNGSSYKALIYILLVALSFLVMHINLKLNYYYHRQEIKSIDFSQSEFVTESVPTPKNQVVSTVVESVDTSEVVQTNTIPVKDTVSLTERVISDQEYFEQLLQSLGANIQREDSATLPRKDVVIRYYKKSTDGDRVYKLRELGYYIHERPAEGEFDHFGSNAIFYGDDVTNEELAVIAYYLINNGVQLQSISLSKFHDTWKAHSVEIGTDTTVLDQPKMTLSSLRNSWRDF